MINELCISLPVLPVSQGLQFGQAKKTIVKLKKRNMKTLKILFIVLLAIGLTNCKKDIQEDEAQYAEIEFAIDHITPDVAKDGATPVPDCSLITDMVPVKAVIVIDGVTYEPEVFFVGGKLYTQTIKLDLGLLDQKTFTVTSFHLLNAADQVIMATPLLGSIYAAYVDKPLNFEFTVAKFKKIQVEADVLCYIPAEYENFGFSWFIIDRVIVREFCFFGDFCIKNTNDYLQSPYNGQPGFPQSGYFDAIALMKIVVYRNGELVDVDYTNVNNIFNPLCVKYPDYMDEVDNFQFDLYIIVKVGNVYKFVKFYTFTSVDDGPLSVPVGNDGVLDFVLGSCNHNTTDLVLPPYQNLPETAGINLLSANYSQGGYWNMKVEEVDGHTNSTYQHGYDLPGIGANFIGWCGDEDSEIGTGFHTFNLYSSTAANWPAGALPTYVTKGKLAGINWLINNISSFSGFGNVTLTTLFVTPGALSPAQGEIFQQAVWGVINGNSPGGVAGDMKTAALAHTDFVPLPGQYAAVVMMKEDNSKITPFYQMIFYMVDP